jgi:hypothetical protein
MTLLTAVVEGGFKNVSELAKVTKDELTRGKVESPKIEAVTNWRKRAYLRR